MVFLNTFRIPRQIVIGGDARRTSNKRQHTARWTNQTWADMLAMLDAILDARCLTSDVWRDTFFIRQTLHLQYSTVRVPVATETYQHSLQSTASLHTRQQWQSATIPWPVAFLLKCERLTPQKCKKRQIWRRIATVVDCWTVDTDGITATYTTTLRTWSVGCI